MGKTSSMACVGLFLVGMALAAPPPSAVHVKSGDRIAFPGDSITELGNGSDGHVNMVMEALDANGIRAEKIPAGVSGNKSTQMLERLELDVLSKNPQIMTLSCGVNDVWHGVNGVPLEKYARLTEEIVDRAQARGIRVYILTSTMIGEGQGNDDNRKLVAYNDFPRALAKERKCVLIDVAAAMQGKIAKGEARWMKMVVPRWGGRSSHGRGLPESRRSRLPQGISVREYLSRGSADPSGE